MPPLFIVNPRSGHAARALPAVRAFAAARGAEVATTTHRGHAGALAAAAVAAGRPFVVAVGGDGTMNEIAAALVGTATPLGLVPCGSGNGLARHLGVFGSCDHALGLIAAGQIRCIDTGIAAGLPFFNVAGLGFEAAVAERFNRLVKRGLRRYVPATVGLLRTYRSEVCTVTVDAATLTTPVFTLAVANSDQYGNAARIAPGARVDDGLLDVTVLPPPTLANGVPLAVRLFTGRLDRQRSVTRLRGARIVVQRPVPGPLHTDGEVHPAPATVEFQVRPASLRVFAPRVTAR